ncbi:hypothetical protein [Chachezhania sediminis]|uniref:hypothetical protein n=1 Tax=Chachezhania sediminis TaxID=2599291 RepID=UPI00131C4F1D|nr:hypothetical protein [Chachezhania sediminis]
MIEVANTPGDIAAVIFPKTATFVTPMPLVAVMGRIVGALREWIAQNRPENVFNWTWRAIFLTRPGLAFQGYWRKVGQRFVVSSSEDRPRRPEKCRK